MDYCQELQRELAEIERDLAYAESGIMDADTVPELIILENMPAITKESAESETGGKVGTRGDININLISKNGVTVETAAEILVSDFPQLDESQTRNTIIDILKTGRKNFKADVMGDLKDQKATVLAKRKEFENQCIGDVRADDFGEMARMINAMRSGEVRDLSKAEVMKAARYYQDLRGDRAAEMDEKRDSKKRLTPNSVNLFRWMKAPEQFDLIGIDTESATNATADLKIKHDQFWSRFGFKPKQKGASKRKKVQKSASKRGSVQKYDLWKIPFTGQSGDGYFVTIASDAKIAKRKFYQYMTIYEKMTSEPMPTTYKFIGNDNMIKSVKEGRFARVFPPSRKSASTDTELVLPNRRKDTIVVKPFGGMRKPLELDPFDYTVLDKKGRISYDYFGQKIANRNQYTVKANPMPKRKRSSKAATRAKQALLGRYYVLHEYLAYQMPDELFGKPLSNWNYTAIAQITKDLEREYNQQNSDWEEDLIEPLAQIDEWLEIINTGK